MATVGERLVRIEEIIRENRSDIDGILALINSGPGVDWKQSIRGRLHDVQTRLASEEALTQAIREVRRSNNKRVATWVQIVVAASAIVTAACAVAAAVLQVLG